LSMMQGFQDSTVLFESDSKVFQVYEVYIFAKIILIKFF
jgi:hypothetical protein